MLVHMKRIVSIVSLAAVSMFLTVAVSAQAPDQEPHIKCPVTSESIIRLDWPKVARSVIPAYPAVAAAKRISGPVRVDVEVDPKGSVTAARVITGHQLLAAASREAALRWTFQPTESKHSISLHFIYRAVDYVEPKEKPECDGSPYTVDIRWIAAP